MIKVERHANNISPLISVSFGCASILLFRLLFLTAVSLSVFISTPAQEPDINEISPPPLRLMTKEEKLQLNTLNDVKKRTKLSLELMEARLLRSEELKTREMFDEMFIELGGFHSLMDNTLEFLNESDKNSDKVLYNFKRLEIGLRRFTPRLEVIRRDLPLAYEHYLRTLIRYLREARAKAIAPLFDDTVVPNRNKKT